MGIVVNSKMVLNGTSVMNQPARVVVGGGLLFHFDVSNPASYPGSGNDIFDLSGNGNDATIQGTPVFDAADGGSIVTGNPNFISVALTPTLQIFNTYTYQVWVKASAFLGFMTIVDQDDDTHFFGVNGTTLESFSPTYSSGLRIAVDQWYNVAMTHAPATGIAFYVDGAFILRPVTNIPSPNATTNYINFGAGSSSGTSGNEFWNGNLGAGMMYTTELTAGEILQNFNATRTRFGV